MISNELLILYTVSIIIAFSAASLMLGYITDRSDVKVPDVYSFTVLSVSDRNVYIKGESDGMPSDVLLWVDGILVDTNVIPIRDEKKAGYIDKDDLYVIISSIPVEGKCIKIRISGVYQRFNC